MISVGKVDLRGLDRLIGGLAGLRKPDVRPLLDATARMLVEENARKALAGLDCNNQPLRVTQRERLASRSRRLGSGKPLAPRYRASRIITRARAAGFVSPDGGFQVVLDWPGFTDRKGRPILGHHQKGIRTRSGFKIVRDVVSHARPDTVKRFRAMARAFYLGQVFKFRG